MSRLIDADEFMIKLAAIAKEFAKSDKQKALMGRAMYCLENQPTAYDVKKVVEQLEEMKSLSKDAVEYEKRHGSIEDRIRAEQSLKDLSKVINIVREGGVEDAESI
uniref:hypothetical protein n=1 Tax=Acetatifactor sp. TaxID=1872090 RepID=UPI0040574AC3